jgi:hypothetical protein
MERILILTIAVFLAAFGSAHAQTGSPAASASAGGSIAGSSGVPASSGANSSASGINPALNLQGMPCSVSLNATGGITTSSSCGSDPLEVAARTIVSAPQVSSSQAPSVQTSGFLVTGGTQSTLATGGTNNGSAVSGTGTATVASSGGAVSSSGAALNPSTLCSTILSPAGGPTGVASLVGGC